MRLTVALERPCLRGPLRACSTSFGITASVSVRRLPRGVTAMDSELVCVVRISGANAAMAGVVRMRMQCGTVGGVEV